MAHRSLLLISIVLFIFFMATNRGLAAEKPTLINEIKPLMFSEVIPSEGRTKDQLYSAAVAWFGETFQSAKNVIDIQDREAGRIIGKPLFKYTPVIFMAGERVRGVVHYDVTIEVKDGRYRYKIDNFTHEGSSGSYSGIPLAPISFQLLTREELCPYDVDGVTSSGKQETWVDLKQKSKDEAERLILSIKSRMAQSATKSEDW